MFSIVLLGSCSSEKTLSEQIKYDWDINYNSSKDDGNERPYNPIKNLKNSSVFNQTEAKPNLSLLPEDQNLTASKDIVESIDLKNTYRYKNLTKTIQNNQINKSFLDKSPIFEKKNSSNKSKIKDKTKKILWILACLVFSVAAGLMTLISLLFFALGLPTDGVVGLLICIILYYLIYKSLEKIRESNSKDNNKDSAT